MVASTTAAGTGQRHRAIGIDLANLSDSELGLIVGNGVLTGIALTSATGNGTTIGNIWQRLTGAGLVAVAAQVWTLGRAPAARQWTTGWHLCGPSVCSITSHGGPTDVFAVAIERRALIAVHASAVRFGDAHGIGVGHVTVVHGLRRADLAALSVTTGLSVLTVRVADTRLSASDVPAHGAAGRFVGITSAHRIRAGTVCGAGRTHAGDIGNATAIAAGTICIDLAVIAGRRCTHAVAYDGGTEAARI